MSTSASDRRLDDIRKLLIKAKAYTDKIAKQPDGFAKEFRRELKASRAQHDRDMKEIRALLSRWKPRKKAAK